MNKSMMVEDLVNYYSDGSKSSFAEKIGVKPQTIHSWISRGTFDSELIFAKCENVSSEWLLSGNGSMLRENIKMPPTNTKRLYTPKFQESIIEEQSIPYYSIEATAGVLEHLDNSAEYQIGQIMIPNMPRCDGAVSITGDSMYPLLKSGDIVAFQVVHDINNIHFGDMYLVSINEDGDTYITVKWVKKHPSDPEKAVLESHNPNYSPRDVLLKHIHKIALIKFSIRYNSMG
ncbi:S24 family peptidase [Porphyromonadaceae bacterium W3.11]|nr:S24 family peptidase [Porphyromonadaceae bacterium W3.11]